MKLRGLKYACLVAAATGCVQSGEIEGQGPSSPFGETQSVLQESVELDPGLDLETPTALTRRDVWADADALTKVDGVPRIPVETVSGTILMQYEVVDGHMIVDGELDFGPVQSVQAQRDRGVGYRQVWFPSGSIPWAATSMTNASKAEVRTALNYLEAHTPLNFGSPRYRLI